MLDFIIFLPPAMWWCFICCFISRGWEGKFQGKWLSIFWSVRYAPTDNFPLPLLTNQIYQKHKIRNSVIFQPVFARLVPRFPRKRFFGGENNFDRAFLQMEPFVKSFCAEGRLRLSKQQQLNFHQNTSLPQEGTTKSIPVLHQNRKGETDVKKSYLNIIHYLDRR